MHPIKICRAVLMTPLLELPICFIHVSPTVHLYTDVTVLAEPVATFVATQVMRYTISFRSP